MKYVRLKIKADAKLALKSLYWACIGVTVLTMVIENVVSSASWMTALNKMTKSGLSSWSMTDFLLHILTLMLSPLLQVGVTAFFIRVFRRQEAGVGTMFTEGISRYWRKLGAIAWMGLCLFGWVVLCASPIVLIGFLFPYALLALNEGQLVLIVLVLMIPALIKAVSYVMVSFILADCPQVGARKALKLSKRMSRGMLSTIFIFYSSFIGWYILVLAVFWPIQYVLNLNAITLPSWGSLSVASLPHIFFIYPYMSLAIAGLYDHIKGKAVADGIIQPEEFGPQAV